MVPSFQSSSCGLAMLVAIITLAPACDGGFEQGSCEPGYLEVHGDCKIAVGQVCTGGGDCLSGICEKPDDTQGFCTIGCKGDANCPTGFYCNTAGARRCFPGKRPEPCQADGDCLACQSCQQGFCVDISGCQACAADEDCQACQRCDSERCIDVAGCRACAGDADCQACESCAQDGVCRVLSGCVLCSFDGQCPGCQECEQGACRHIEGCGTDHCFNDTFCPPRTRCLFNSYFNDTTCLPVDLPFGSDCQAGGDETCAGEICIENEDGSMTCSSICATDDDCPEHNSCTPDENCLWACRKPYTPPAGSVCLDDTDCEDDRICGLVPNLSQTAWDTRCLVPNTCVGSAPDECDPSHGEQCSSGICTLDGFCSPVCAGDLDCPSGFLCDILQLYLPAGQAAGFYGCGPEDAVCSEIGEACPNGDADCKSMLCMPTTIGGPGPFCTRVCNPQGADCPDLFSCRPDPQDAENYVCQPTVIGGECGRDIDCPDPRLCGLLDEWNATRCIDALPGGALPGEACNSQTPCAGGLCLDSGSCSSFCLAPEDCPPSFICDYQELVGPKGERTYASLCRPPPGSLTSCKRDSDCQDQESCRPVLDMRATGLDGRCTKAGNGSDVGVACEAGYDCRSGFCPEIGVCSSLCLEDPDCPQGYRCQEGLISFWSAKSFSVSMCIEFVPAELSEPCPGGDPDCAQDLKCFQPTAGEAYCSKPCQTNLDCATADNMFCLDDGNGGLLCQTL